MSVVPDPGATVNMLTCSPAGPGPGTPPPPPGPPPTDGEPVYLSTGTFVYRQTDFFLPDTIPIDFQRVYFTGDNATPVRSFGIGMTHSYNMFLWSGSNGTALVLPDGNQILFDSTTGTAIATPTNFDGAQLGTTSDGVSDTVRLKDGTTLLFARTDPLRGYGEFYHDFLSGIQDRNGKVVS
jgi:hypothetical protein